MRQLRTRQFQFTWKTHDDQTETDVMHADDLPEALMEWRDLHIESEPLSYSASLHGLLIEELGDDGLTDTEREQSAARYQAGLDAGPGRRMTAHELEVFRQVGWQPDEYRETPADMASRHAGPVRVGPEISTHTAIKWTGDNLAEVTEFCGSEDVYYEDNSLKILYSFTGAWSPVPKHWWIVRYDQHSIVVMSPGDFADTYTEFSNEPMFPDTKSIVHSVNHAYAQSEARSGADNAIGMADITESPKYIERVRQLMDAARNSLDDAQERQKGTGNVEQMAINLLMQREQIMFRREAQDLIWKAMKERGIAGTPE